MQYTMSWRADGRTLRDTSTTGSTTGSATAACGRATSRLRWRRGATMDEGTSFGSWVRRHRKGLDLTQDELARGVGVSVAMIRRLEADERRPSREVAARLAQVLAIP